MRLTAAGVALLLFTPLLTGSAQQQPPIEAGTRVRVTSSSMALDRYVGTLVALRADTLIVDSLRVGLAGILQLEVSRGRTTNAGRGALIGGGIGLPVGALAGFALGRLCYLDRSDEEARRCRIISTVVSAGVLGAVGAGIGALIGAGRESDQWEQVPLAQLRVVVVPILNRGLTLVISVGL